MIAPDPIWERAKVTVQRLDGMIRCEGDYPPYLPDLEAADVIADAMRDAVAAALRQLRSERPDRERMP